MNTANLIACGIIFVWSMWCVFGKTVRDGILGKIMYSIIALAAISGVLAGYRQGVIPPQMLAMNICLAGLGVRQWVIEWLRPVFDALHGLAQEEGHK